MRRGRADYVEDDDGKFGEAPEPLVRLYIETLPQIRTRTQLDDFTRRVFSTYSHSSLADLKTAILERRKEIDAHGDWSDPW